MADYNANIKVNADTRQAESQLKKLQNSLDKLSDISTKVNLQSAQQQFNKLGTTLRGIGERGALGAITLGAGKAAASIGGLGAKFGILGAAAASAGATINGALGGVPGVITDILAQAGHLPNAFGLAAVAAMAFAPQILKASSATVGLGAAIDKAVGKQTTEKIAGVVDSIGRLNIELEATKATFESLIAGNTLNQLNSQLKDAVKESGEFHSSTEEAVIAAQQLVAVQREQRREQKAITDLIRQAQGLQPQDVRDTEVSRRVALLKSREVQQRKDLQLQNQINAELAEYERLAAEVANQTKQWANNLDRIARSSRAGVLGSQSQIQARLQEFRENRRSTEIARQRSAELLARERGGQYSLAQVPARGELFPGGRSETAAPQFRERLNTQALVSQALEQSGRTRLQIEAAIFRASKQISSVQVEQNKLDERSVQLAKERNQLLMEQYRLEQRRPIAAMTPQQRAAAGVLDPASLRADRLRRIEQGRAQQQRRREMTENVIIGGAFPMLFGGGPGAVIGGAAGGFIPGNPMLSVATSALGALLDQFATSVTEMGSNLRDPIANFQKLADAGLIASRSQQKYIERLIEAGRVTEAATLIQEEIIQKIGVQGVTDLQNAGAASSMFNKQLAELNLQMQAAVAGPLTGMLRWLNQFLASVTAYNRQQAAQTDFLTSLREANPQAYQQYFKESMQLREANRGTVDPAALQRLQQQYTQRYNLQPGTVTSSIDKTAESQAKAVTQELAAQVQLEAQKLTLSGMSLEKDGMGFVAVAKRVAQQEYENKLLEIKNYWIGKTYDAEKNQLMIRQANLQFAAKVNELDLQAARAAEQANDERIRAYQQTLQLQNQLAQTVLDEYRILEQGVDLYKGPIAGYEKSLILLERRTAIQEGIIRNEYESAQASKEYAANQATIDATFENRLNNLKLEKDFLEAQLNIQRERARLEEELAARQLISQNAQRRVAGQTEIDRLQTQLDFPFGGEQLDRDMQMLDQYTRRMEELVPLQEKIMELQTTIGRATQTPGVLTEDQLKQKQKDLVIQQDQLRELEAELQLRDQLEQQLLRQQQVYAKYGFIADEVSRALSDSITGLVTGTTTVTEAFSRMFESIGKAFIDMATQMLAQKLFMTVLGALIPGGSPLGNPAGSGGNVLPGGWQQYAFAEGGFVTGPTRALIGEGGEPEYVIPASKMRTAMGRYSAGARGSSVVSGTGKNSSENGVSTATMEPIDVRYSIERINNVDYVTADQFQRGMAHAAQQGAIQGERRAMRSLKNSAATRRGVGI